MSAEGSVTNWLRDLQRGDETAAQRLWERYVDRLIRMARGKLGNTPRRAADEEDVVLSAFNNFFRGVRDGRFPRLQDRHDLWQVLVVLTDRRATDQIRRALTRNRMETGARYVADADSSQSQRANISQVVNDEPTPEFAAQAAEELEQLFESLGDPGLRQVAQWKMEGYTNAEIAEKLDCTTRTVERKLSMIRDRWEGLV